MKNFVQPGRTLTLTAPYDVKSGGGVLVGTIFGVASEDVNSGDDGEFDLEGVFDLPKATGAVSQGAALYWDDTNKNLTTTTEGNTKVGAATAGAAADATIVRMRLNGSF